MPNTYTQIYIQIVFAVKHRKCLIHSENRDELHQYITGIIQNRNQKLISIFAMPDHIHILIGMTGSVLLSDLVRDIKTGSTNFINSRNWVSEKFAWQTGYGAFSYSRSQLGNVINYIQNQETHHQKKSFKEEYIRFLQKFEIDYDEKYLFDWIH